MYPGNLLYARQPGADEVAQRAERRCWFSAETFGLRIMYLFRRGPGHLVVEVPFRGQRGYQSAADVGHCLVLMVDVHSGVAPADVAVDDVGHVGA